MNGKRASRWMLVGGALMASALVLGGCIADAGDDEQVGESQAAVNGDPASSDDGLVAVVDPEQGLVLEAPATGGDTGAPGDTGDSVGDTPDGCEPEPNPWVPPVTQTGSGATATNPQPQQGPQGQMKH